MFLWPLLSTKDKKCNFFLRVKNRRTPFHWLCTSNPHSYSGDMKRTLTSMELSWQGEEAKNRIETSQVFLKSALEKYAESWSRSPSVILKKETFLVDPFNLYEGGTALHRGSVCASHPAVPGSIPLSAGKKSNPIVFFWEPGVLNLFGVRKDFKNQFIF